MNNIFSPIRGKNIISEQREENSCVLAIQLNKKLIKLQDQMCLSEIVIHGKVYILTSLSIKQGQDFLRSRFGEWSEVS